MTKEEAIAHGKEQLEVFGGEHAEFIKLAIKALEQEPCEDAISRQSMLDYLKYLHGEMPEEEFVNALPSVTPARKKGKWIYSGSYDEVGILFCSKCKHEIDVSEGYFKYCPNCGAEMEGEEESK